MRRKRLCSVLLCFAFTASMRGTPALPLPKLSQLPPPRSFSPSFDSFHPFKRLTINRSPRFELSSHPSCPDIIAIIIIISSRISASQLSLSTFLIFDRQLKLPPYRQLQLILTEDRSSPALCCPSFQPHSPHFRPLSNANRIGKSCSTCDLSLCSHYSPEQSYPAASPIVLDTTIMPSFATPNIAIT